MRQIVSILYVQGMNEYYIIKPGVENTCMDLFKART